MFGKGLSACAPLLLFLKSVEFLFHVSFSLYFSVHHLRVLMFTLKKIRYIK